MYSRKMIQPATASRPPHHPDKSADHPNATRISSQDRQFYVQNHFPGGAEGAALFQVVAIAIQKYFRERPPHTTNLCGWAGKRKVSRDIDLSFFQQNSNLSPFDLIFGL
jgi:hypothetical protein